MSSKRKIEFSAAIVSILQLALFAISVVNRYTYSFTKTIFDVAKHYFGQVTRNSLKELYSYMQEEK